MRTSVTVYFLFLAATIIATGCKKNLTPPDKEVLNASPKVLNVSIAGTPQVNSDLTCSYTYVDLENDIEGGTIFQWYRADDVSGLGETAIAGATSLTYHLADDDQTKFIRIGVKPKAVAGTIDGIEVKSNYIGPIGESTTITFIYNGQPVIYSIITSPATGRKWLDRNLGAMNTPSSFDDFANYGDLFQWGRGDDGHQVITRTGNLDANATAVNGTTTNLSNSDNPGHSQFILASTSPNNWRSPANNGLWQGVNGINNPCPNGWRLPTEAEWTAESLGGISSAYSKLKITLTGNRSASNGTISQTTLAAQYWTSTVFSTDPNYSIRVRISSSTTSQSYDSRAVGKACRCIKN